MYRGCILIVEILTGSKHLNLDKYAMQATFIKIRFDLKCDWVGFGPDYQIYVNDELFIERTYTAISPEYYSEMLQIYAEPGRYKIHLKIISPQKHNLRMSSTRIEIGNGIIHSVTEFEIL